MDSLRNHFSSVCGWRLLGAFCGNWGQHFLLLLLTCRGRCPWYQWWSPRVLFLLVEPALIDCASRWLAGWFLTVMAIWSMHPLALLHSSREPWSTSAVTGCSMRPIYSTFVEFWCPYSNRRHSQVSRLRHRLHIAQVHWQLLVDIQTYSSFSWYLRTRAIASTAWNTIIT